MAIIIYFIFSLVFLVLGSLIVASSKSVLKLSLRYDDICPLNQQCNLKFKIEEDLQGPILLAYKLTDFYQNHRLYILEASYEQLANMPVSSNI
jgi:hypothetical protein